MLFVLEEACYIRHVAAYNKYDCVFFSTINHFYNQYITKNTISLDYRMNEINVSF